MDNWLLIIVGVIFLIGIIVGYVRGFLRIGLSLLSTILTVILVVFLTPYVSSALTKYTPLDTMIEEKCIEAFMPEISADALKDKDLSGTPLANLNADELADINNIDLDKYNITEKDIMNVLGEIPKDTQVKAIENAAIPEFLKKLLTENNNNEIYETLNVFNFPEYAGAYLARMAVQVIAFLVTFLLVIIIVKALMAAVDIIGDLPVLGIVNRLAGALTGIVGALLIIWLAFLILSLIYTTEAGKACFAMIDKDPILTFLYDHNILLNKLLEFK